MLFLRLKVLVLNFQHNLALSCTWSDERRRRLTAVHVHHVLTTVDERRRRLTVDERMLLVLLVDI